LAGGKIFKRGGQNFLRYWKVVKCGKGRHTRGLRGVLWLRGRQNRKGSSRKINLFDCGKKRRVIFGSRPEKGSAGRSRDM